MKNFYLRILLVSFTLGLIVPVNAQVDPKKKAVENTIDYARNKYETGYYYEVIAKVSPDKLFAKKPATLSDHVRVTTYGASSHYALLNFNSAEESIKAAIEKITASSSDDKIVLAYAWSFISEYYMIAGDLVTAEKYLKSANDL